MSKILLVEDETSLLEVYSDFLESAGNTVLKATDGDTGLHLALNENWDVLFLDVMLPRLDGVEILKKLSAQGIIPGKPVIMLTNLDSDSVISECMNLGASGHLSKAQINPQDLLDMVTKYATSINPQTSDNS